MTDFFGRFSMAWASNGQPMPPTDAQAAQGFPFLGQTTPSAQLHDALFQWNDLKDNYLFAQISSVFVSLNSTISESAPSAMGALLVQYFAPLSSPAFSGTPTAPTPASGGTPLALANVQYVSNAISPLAPKNSPVFTGAADFSNTSSTIVPIPPQADSSNKAAPTYFVKAEVYSETQRAMAVESSLAPIRSPFFQGLPQTVTPPNADSSTLIPNTVWVLSALLQGWPLGNLKNVPGFLVLPTGIILQWGVAQSGVSGSTTVNLPMPYPNSPLVTLVCEENAPGSWYGSQGVGTPTVHGLAGQSKSQVSFYSMQWHFSGVPSAGTGSWQGQQGVGFTWLSIGF